MADPAPGRVTVAVPYHGACAYLGRAVESLLAQTHRELTVVVVNDGDPEPPWPLLDHLDDPRLVRFDLDANRGRYFADEVVLQATDDPWFLVQDADDWSEPTRVQRLLREVRRQHASGAVSARRLEGGNGAGRVERWPRLGTPLPATMGHRATQQGLFRADALRRAGGFHPGFRVGYDTLLINLLEMLGRVVAVDEPLYHATVRTGSLTTASATCWGSARRADAVRRLQALYAAAHRAYRRYLDGSYDERRLVAAVQALVRGSCAQADLASVREQAARLRRLLAGRPAVTPARARPAAAQALPPTPAAEPLRVYELIAPGGPPFHGWQIGPTLAVELAEHLERTRPRALLQTGSGSSTAVLAAHVARRGGTLTVLEDDERRLRRAAERLAAFGLSGSATLRLAGLRGFRCPDGVERPWYDVSLTDRYDFVFLDGPPLATGRAAALFALEPALAEDAEVWLHDAHRPHERECLELWRELPFRAEIHDLDDRGTAVLSRARATSGAAPADWVAPVDVPAGLAVTLLTGGRPALLRRMVESVARAVPELFARARVTVLVNGDDPESDAVVRGLPFVDHVLRHRGPRLRTGPAASRLVDRALRRGADRYLLHLEDDWEVCTLDATWLGRAAALLDGERRIGQVRLRHRGERVRSRHMITGQPIRWEERDGYALSPSAHWTFNPSLIRAADARVAWPAEDEPAAQRHFLRSGLWAAQLTPGAFRHIG
jgi:hypothetical protein